MGDVNSRTLQPKKSPISQDYRVTASVLGLGINGKVVECFSHQTGEKYALKVIYSSDSLNSLDTLNCFGMTVAVSFKIGGLVRVFVQHISIRLNYIIVSTKLDEPSLGFRIS